MANSNKPNGFVLVGTLDGSPLNGNVREYTMTGASNIMIGDMVALDDTTGLVTPASAGGLVLGVCVGVKVNRAYSATEHPGYAPASSGSVVQVAVGPNYIYSVQEDSVGGTPLAQSNVGSNGDLVVGTANTTVGRSGMMLDTSDVIAKDASAASAQLKVLGLDPVQGNAVGNYARWLVKINEHVFTDTTGI